jgi:glycosyltransferase involved in cell wall biosynthesis
MTAAIFYEADGYDTSKPKLMGRHAAGEGFLSGLAQHGRAPTLGCYTGTEAAFRQFNGLLRSFTDRPPKTRWIPRQKPEQLAAAGCLYVPGPGLDTAAWLRRRVSDRSHSLCGVTHTIASAGAADALGNLVLAPIESWDALICTSAAVKAAAVRLIDDWREYLGERCGAVPPLRAQLPIIPLGVDCQRFSRQAASRADWRRRMGIAESAVVFLFMGRLSFHAKAHPLPMYLALERAAQVSGQRIVLIQAGWFANEGLRRAFVEGARQYCPLVDVIFMDGRRPDVREHIWHAADVFITLSDNVQETFGLTPIEAMAAGLPVVASDWNGYRQTVVDGVTGFMIPTTMPEASCGVDLVRRFIDGQDDYDYYIGATSQAIAVDVEAASEACTALVCDPALRARMGAEGRRRAEEIFDWRHIVRQYEELWSDLASRRAHAATVTAGRGTPAGLHPLRGSPYRIYEHYATRVLTDHDTVALAVENPVVRHNEIVANPMNTFADAALAPRERRLAVLKFLAQGPASIATILKSLQARDPDRLRRTISWFLKCGLVRVV